ncbi:MAG TPA: DUF5118 domain-containing protein, partial [Candidatus Krumholzibacteria bacterium]
MFRNIGVLALVVCLCLVTGSALANDLSTASASPTPAFTDDAKGEPKAEAKQMKERPYAEKLHRKLKKEGPAGPEPKYKPWSKVVTPEHKKQEGLLTFYSKQEELLLEIPKTQLDKPMLAILSISRGIGADFVYGGLPIDDVMFDFHRDQDHILMRRLSTNFRAGDNQALKNAMDLTFCESILENFPIKSEKGDHVVID